MWRGVLWMVGLSLLLFWLPIAGPFLAGFVGGRIIGRIGRALIAALIPSIVLAGLVAGVLFLVDLPVIGTLAGLGVFIAILVEDIPMLGGAALGAALTEPR